MNEGKEGGEDRGEKGVRVLVGECEQCVSNALSSKGEGLAALRAVQDDANARANAPAPASQSSRRAPPRPDRAQRS